MVRYTRSVTSTGKVIYTSRDNKSSSNTSSSNTSNSNKGLSDSQRKELTKQMYGNKSYEELNDSQKNFVDNTNYDVQQKQQAELKIVKEKQAQVEQAKVEAKAKQIAVVGYVEGANGTKIIQDMPEQLTAQEKVFLSESTSKYGRTSYQGIKKTETPQGTTRELNISYQEKVKEPTTPTPLFTTPLLTPQQQKANEILNSNRIDVSPITSSWLDRFTFKADRDLVENPNQVVGLTNLGIGVVEGAIITPYNMIRHPIETTTGIIKLGAGLLTDPVETLTPIGESIVQNPTKFIGNIAGGLVVSKVFSIGVTKGINKYGTPEVVGGSIGTAERITISDDLAQTTTQESTIIKSGNKFYGVKSTSLNIEKSDIGGAKLISEKTQLEIIKTNSKGTILNEYSGISKGEFVTKTTETGTTLSRGDVVLGVNLNNKVSRIKELSVYSIGKTDDLTSTQTSIIKEKPTIEGTYLESLDFDKLKFTSTKPTKVTVIETSTSTKIVEVEAPVKLFSQDGVNIFSEQKFKTELFEISSEMRGGKLLTPTEKVSKLVVDPYGNKIIYPDNVEFVYGIDDIKPQAVNSNFKQIEFKPKGNELATLQTQKVVTQPVSKIGTGKTQAVILVKEIVKEESILAGKITGQITTPILEAGILIKTKPAQAQILTKAQAQVIEQAKKTKYITKYKTFTSIEQITETAQKPAILVRTKLAQAQLIIPNEQVIEPVVVPPIVVPPIITPTKITPIVVPPILPVIPIRKFDFRKEQKQDNLFDVEIRKGGVWGKATSKRLTQQEALDFGTYAVDTTTTASFRITPNSTRKSLGMFSNIDINAIKGSYNKKKSQLYEKDNIFIENRRFRISTGGEKIGLKKAKAEKRFGLW